MAQLSAPRNTTEVCTPDARYDSGQLADSATTYKGGLAAMNASGMIQPQVGSGTALTVGRFDASLVAGTGNALQVPFKSGTFIYANGDSITLADRGKSCFVGDDQTVFKANTGGKPYCGKIYNVTSEGVAVSIASPLNTPAPGGSGMPVL